MQHFKGTAQGLVIQELATTYYYSKDSKSFDRLYVALRPMLMVFAETMLDRTNAEEAVTETLIKAWSKADMYDPEKSRYSTWIFTVCKNECLQFMVRKKRKKETVLLEAVTANLESTCDEPGRDVEQLHEAAVEAILDLPEMYRKPLMMYSFQDMKYEDIATELGMTCNTVKTRIMRARALVKGVISPPGSTAPGY